MSDQRRKDEILAKKAKLAEIRRAREQRERGKTQRESLGASSADVTPIPDHSTLQPVAKRTR